MKQTISTRGRAAASQKGYLGKWFHLSARLSIASLGALLSLAACAQIPQSTAAVRLKAQAYNSSAMFSDDFNASLSSTLWRILDSHSNINSEPHYYAPDEVYTSGGNLVIRTQRRNYGGRSFSSGMVMSKQAFLYGRFEFRAQMSPSQWPTLWLLKYGCFDPLVNDCLAWPPEIDVIEQRNAPSRFTAGTWYGPHSNPQKDGVDVPSSNLSQTFHTYTLVWEPDRVEIYLDGELKYNLTDPALIPYEPMEVVLNTAVSDTSSGAPFPVYHLVDHVRVFQDEDWSGSSVDDTVSSGANRFSYSGNWPSSSCGGCFGGTNHYSSTAGDSYQVNFSGTGVVLQSSKASNNGIAAVSLDGGAETSVDLYSSTAGGDRVIYSRVGLNPGSHTLQVRVTGQKNSLASAVFVSADRVRVLGFNPAGAASTNDTTLGSGLGKFDYSSGWGYAGCSGCFSGDNHYSNTAGDTATFQFSGTVGKLYTSKAPNNGIAAVSIDGGAETNVDLYNASPMANVLMYRSPTLNAGTHTLRVRVTAQKNASSSAAFVSVDRVAVIP
jgi:beta-glucanase (GH16 family)